MIYNPLPKEGSKIAVALSGGVDSSVAACILKDMGYDLTGITLRVSRGLSGQSDCLGDDATLDALRVCQTLGIKHYVLDVSRLFERAILDYFKNEYMRLRTPNPCIRCNELIKWGYIQKRVRVLGIEYIATGHYARIALDTSLNDAPRHFIVRARDTAKDQSYVLWRLNSKHLVKTIFPLGELSKDEVRGIASRFGLHVAGKKDSQDFCLRAGTDLPSRVFELRFKDGRLLGRHDASHPLTIGQRGGMKIAYGKALYVMRIDGNTGCIFLTDDREDLLCSSIRAIKVNCFIYVPDEGLDVTAKIRSVGRVYKAHLHRLGRDEMRVSFNDMPYAAALGQSVVCYIDDVLVAGGIIDGVNEE